TNFSASEVQPDVDIFLNSVPSVSLVGNSGNDFLSTNGGTQGGVDTGTGSPLTSPSLIEGKSGNDTITGGPAGDELIGDAGNDSLFGLGGNDSLRPGTGDDTINRGTGTKTLSYLGDSAGGVMVDLASTGAQNTGQGTVSLANVQNLFG